MNGLTNSINRNMPSTKFEKIPNSSLTVLKMATVMDAINYDYLSDYSFDAFMARGRVFVFLP